MRTPITYYGGKQTMLKHIMPLIPKHEIYSYADRCGWIIHTVERQLSASKKVEAHCKQEEWIVCNYPEPTRQGELNLFAT